MVCLWNIGVDVSGSTHHRPGSEYVPRPVPTPSTFRDQIQAHTHWVNDLVLAHSNEAVVSCSSDLTVKLWRPHSTSHQANTIGVHSDYVKCLATPSGHSDWVASGGLDRKIRVWDLNGGGEKLQIDIAGEDGNNTKGSVYSLGIGGGVVASGGPEGCVRVWDPRSGKPITKFVGHTDNVRAILVSEQGNMVLTASSDTTIKLWSVTAGRCLDTLSMHNDSVWSLHSSHPGLEIFHSSDRSGLIAKTDIRNVAEVEDGICVAVCQEKGGVNKVVAAGDYLWTATSSSSINRWMDVDTNADLVSDYRRPRVASSASSRPRIPFTSSVGTGASSPPPPAGRHAIPITALLRMSTSSSFPSNVRDPDAVTVYSMASARQTSISETIMEGDPGVTVPYNEIPDETIEGQRGLVKHFLLNDRRRVLTVDTAGEVVMWDLLKCVPIKSFGERHLEDVAMEVNTTDSIANWCQVDTRTGKLACVLEENYCFDAEMYADEADIEEKLEFRDDQRINMGKWVLRYLFSNLIDEEIRRDEEYRKTLEEKRVRKENIQLQLPPTTFSMIDAAGSPVTTPTAKNTGSGFYLFPQTPNMGIGVATPNVSFMTTPWDGDTARKSMERQSVDYFSSGGGVSSPLVKNSGATPGEPEEVPGSPVETKEEKGTSRFGWRPFGNKKLGRSASTDMGTKSPLPNTDEKPSEQTVAEENSDKPDALDETLGAVIRKIRAGYERDTSDEGITTVISPSLPQETPVLKPPHGTSIIVQEEKPDFGGVADLYRGTVGSLGEDADLLERVMPAWLAELLLLNRTPFKDTIKVSFVLVPWQDELPVLPSESGSEGKNSRLNANRMLRAKKVLAYVAEHLAPPFMNTSYVPKPKDGGDPPKPEEWLELFCHDQIVPPTMTLATIRSFVWKTGGDVTLHYRRKDRPVLETLGEKRKDTSGKTV